MNSEISHMHNTDGSANQWRTSSTYWLTTVDDTIYNIELNCAKLLRIPQENQEPIQVLRYTAGQRYDLHRDYFDLELYKGTDIENAIRGDQNRVATLFWYMSDVDSGGWTYFPSSGKLPPPYSNKLKRMSDCNEGLKIQPRKGSVILFYNHQA
eukprot:83230_1